MNLEVQLNNLQERLTGALRELPGATALYLFGSRATGQTDGYADLDLQVCTHSRIPSAVWPQFLERAGAIEAAWPLTSSVDNTTFTILFRNESYYHKVDIGLSADGTGVAPTEAGIQLWSQPPALNEAVFPASAAYLPTYGSAGYQVLEELIASERYVKARIRKQHLLCWRFMRIKPDRWLQLHFAKRQARQWCEAPLTTPEVKALENSLSADECGRFSSHLDWAAPAMMDASLLWFTIANIQLLEAMAKLRNERLPKAIIERHLRFISDELGVLATPSS